MENPNDWTSEKDVSCMYSLSQQDTSRDNRLNMLVESRVRREVQARFGGEFLETYRRNTARHRVLKCRNIVRRNYDRRILCDITTLFLLAAFNQEGSESAQEKVFLADLGGTHLFHKTFHDS